MRSLKIARLIKAAWAVETVKAPSTVWKTVDMLLALSGSFLRSYGVFSVLTIEVGRESRNVFGIYTGLRNFETVLD